MAEDAPRLGPSSAVAVTDCVLWDPPESNPEVAARLAGCLLLKMWGYTLWNNAMHIVES